MADIYSYTSVSVIWNGLVANTIVYAIRNWFVEVSLTERKVILAGLYQDISKISISNGYIIDLLDGSVNARLNDSMLLQGDSNSLLSTP